MTSTFTFDDLIRYHGPHSPGGVAVAFKAMHRAFPLLTSGAPVPRRAVVVRTAFRGPGARDGFEAVTRAVTDGRYLEATREVLQKHGGLWFQDESYVISRKRD